MTWSQRVSTTVGRRAIIGLGGVYLVLAALWGASLLRQGWSAASAAIEFLLIAIFGVSLLVGGYRLERAGIDPDGYPRIAVWTLVSVAVLIWIAGLVELHPDIDLDRPYLTILLASGMGSVAGLLLGVKETRATSRAREAERVNEDLEETVEELRRTNERLEEFAGIVSHDLQNPLTVAKGSIELAMNDGDDEHLERADRALNRMDTLTEDLLALARQGRSVDELEPVDLEELAAVCWATIPSDDATLTVETEQRVLAHRSRLQELLENLFKNAVEHGSTSPPSEAREDAVEHGSTSPPSEAREDAVDYGGDDVTVVVGDLDEGSGFYVADDGPGIPADDRAEVFESGFSTTEEGTGLGLAIVREIATAHGWEVTATESESGGARIEVRGVEQAGASSDR